MPNEALIRNSQLQKNEGNVDSKSMNSQLASVISLVGISEPCIDGGNADGRPRCMAALPKNIDELISIFENQI